MSSNATVKVNGTSVSGGKVSIDLNNGYKEITIEVTAPDGTTKKTYALTVRHPHRTGKPVQNAVHRQAHGNRNAG